MEPETKPESAEIVPAKTPLMARKEARWAMVAVTLLALMGLIIFAGDVRRRSEVHGEKIRATQSIAAALLSEVLNQKEFRAQRACDQIQSAGGYNSVTITAPSGKVLASSDKNLIGKTLTPPKEAIAKAESRTEDGAQAFWKAIVLGGDNPVGFVRLVY